MHAADRFFETTRGRIVAALRARRGASAFELAREFGVSANAVRQQLAILERDGLVAVRPVRRGKTKPTFEYALTQEGERLFPQRYDRMLNAVLHQIRETGGERAVSEVFEKIGERSAQRLRQRFAGKDTTAAVIELTDVLREQGVEAECEAREGRMILHERCCPYALTVKEHPEVCTAIHTLMKAVVPGESEQTESLATGGTECRFEVTAAR